MFGCPQKYYFVIISQLYLLHFAFWNGFQARHLYCMLCIKHIVPTDYSICILSILMCLMLHFCMKKIHNPFSLISPYIEVFVEMIFIPSLFIWDFLLFRLFSPNCSFHSHHHIGCLNDKSEFLCYMLNR